jgi:uncharacterized repeat protein (TIGR03847 family)
MTRRRYLLDNPDQFLAGTVGEPGDRTFFLQAREGSRIVSVSLEKIQVAAVCQRLTELLDELDQRGIQGTGELDDTPVVRALDEPINEAFRVGTLSLGWDTGAELVLIEAREITDDDDDDDAFSDDEDEDGPDLLRVRLSAAVAREFVAVALQVIASGRPPCPLCGQPLDPQGHLCPRRNGHFLN